jgi:hypothetical protein
MVGEEGRLTDVVTTLPYVFQREQLMNINLRIPRRL